LRLTPSQGSREFVSADSSSTASCDRFVAHPPNVNTVDKSTEVQGFPVHFMFNPP
jgi:hypothetical protein